jgi:hypothetical protein
VTAILVSLEVGLFLHFLPTTFQRMSSFSKYTLVCTRHRQPCDCKGQPIEASNLHLFAFYVLRFLSFTALVFDPSLFTRVDKYLRRFPLLIPITAPARSCAGFVAGCSVDVFSSSASQRSSSTRSSSVASTPSSSTPRCSLEYPLPLFQGKHCVVHRNHQLHCSPV